MKLELRDLSSSETILVPEEGMTFGRAGGDAQYTVRDAGVSKRHARIWSEGGAWFIEDLGSSNGTHLADQRLAEPMEVMAGDTFALSKMKFEVVQVVLDDAPELAPDQATGVQAPKAKAAAKGKEPDPQEDEGTPPPPPKASKSAANAPAGKDASAAKPGKGAAPSAPPKKTAPGKPTEVGKAAKRPSGDDADEDGPSPEADAGGNEAAEAKGVGYFFIAVPKALAFYLASIPLLLVNPIGSIRKGIEKQKYAPMGRMELIAYAIPPLVFTAMLGSISSGIVSAVHGIFRVMSFIPIPEVIGALIGAIVTGFIWHPVMERVVIFLKGESTERSRTNFFLMFMSGTAVLAVPKAVATLLTLIPFALISIVGLLLSLVASLAMLFIVYSWFNHFQVVKWFRTVVLVLGALSVLGVVGAGVSTLLNSLRGIGSGSGTIATGGTAGEISADAQAQIDRANKLAEEAAKAGDEATKNALKGAEAARAAVPVPDKVPEKNPDKGPAKTLEPVAAKTPDPKPEPTKPDPKPDPVAAPTPGPTAVAAPTPAPGPTPINEPPAGVQVAGKGYGGWKARREVVEKRLTEDPTLLNSVSGLLPIYKAYAEKVYEIESKYQKATAKKPAEGAVNARLRDAELYEKTDRELQQLCGKLGVR